MATFQVSKRIKVAEDVNKETIKSFLQEQISEKCKHQVVSEEGSEMVVEGRVLETFFTPVTKFKADIKVGMEDNVAKIHISGTSHVNAVFWSMVTIGLLGSFVVPAFFSIVFLVPIVLFFVQQKRPQVLMESLLNTVEVEYGSS